MSPTEVRRDSRYPFASTPEPLRRRRAATSAVVAWAAIVVTVLWWPSGSTVPNPPAARTAAPRFGGSSAPANGTGPAEPDRAGWAEQLAEEQRSLTADFAGRFVNVVDGVRASPHPRCNCEPASLWLTGDGSAFGVGQRDAFTVAAELGRRAADRKVDLDVRNLGWPRRPLRASLDDLRRRLESAPDGEPDVLVVLDRFEDTAPVDELLQLAEARGTTAVLVAAPRREPDDTTIPGSDVVDLRPLLAATPDAFVDDRHVDERGARAIADAIAPRVFDAVPTAAGGSAGR